MGESFSEKDSRCFSWWIERWEDELDCDYIYRFTHVDTYLLPCFVEMMLVDTFKNGMKRPKTRSFNKGFGLRVEGKIQPSLPAARPQKVTMLTSLALEPLKTTGVGVKGLLKRIVGKTAKYVEAKQCHVVTFWGICIL